jgi:cytochrome P450
VLKDFETYSSARAAGSGKVTRSVDGALSEHQRIVDLILTSQTLVSDPPKHTARRKLQQKGFTRPRIEGMQPFIQELAEKLIDEFQADGSVDFMQEFAYRFSIGVIGNLLGVYPKDLPKLRDGISAFFMLRGAATADERSVSRVADQVAEAFEAVAGPYWYFEEWVRERTGTPREDMASDLANARTPEGDLALTSEEVVAYMVGLVAAGTDTTANLIGNILRYLSESPEVLQEILANLELWEATIEEGLRRSVNTPTTYRVANREVELGGVTIPEGAKIGVSLAGANGDPSHFPDPLRFDPHRENVKDHLGLGIGRHFCLGAPLARKEAVLALRTLYRRLPGLKADLNEPQEFVPLAVPRIRIHQRVTWNA